MSSAPSTPPRSPALPPARPGSLSGGSASRRPSAEADPHRKSRRPSIAKATNLTVALSGGMPKSKTGTLRKRPSGVFGTFREAFLLLDDGDLTFQMSEDDCRQKETHSLLAIKAIKMLGEASTQFQIKFDLAVQGFGGQGGGESGEKCKVVILKAQTHKEAMEWVATIKHELKNQVLVIKNLISTLHADGRQDRAEPFYEQMIELLKVIYDDKEHFEVADAMKSYAKWMAEHGRNEEANAMKKQAKAIKRRCEEGLDTVLYPSLAMTILKKGDMTPHSPNSNPAPRLSSLLPPMSKMKGLASAS